MDSDNELDDWRYRTLNNRLARIEGIVMDHPPGSSGAAGLDERLAEIRKRLDGIERSLEAHREELREAIVNMHFNARVSRLEEALNRKG